MKCHVTTYDELVEALKEATNLLDNACENYGRDVEKFSSILDNTKPRKKGV